MYFLVLPGGFDFFLRAKGCNVEIFDLAVDRELDQCDKVIFECCLVVLKEVSFVLSLFLFGRGMQGPDRGHVRGTTALL